LQNKRGEGGKEEEIGMKKEENIEYAVESCLRVVMFLYPTSARGRIILTRHKQREHAQRRCWGTELQAGMMRVRFPMESFEIFHLLDPSGRRTVGL
jgi:hypothetical protein